MHIKFYKLKAKIKNKSTSNKTKKKLQYRPKDA